MNDARDQKNQPFQARLVYALAGIKAVWHREASFRTQVGFAAAAAAVVAVLRPGWLWTALIAACVGLVLAFELMNSALEYLIDKVHPEIAPEIKRAKDAAAAAVLVASITALAVGVMMVLARAWV